MQNSSSKEDILWVAFPNSSRRLFDFRFDKLNLSFWDLHDVQYDGQTWVVGITAPASPDRYDPRYKECEVRLGDLILTDAGSVEVGDQENSAIVAFDGASLFEVVSLTPSFEPGVQEHSAILQRVNRPDDPAEGIWWHEVMVYLTSYPDGCMELFTLKGLIQELNEDSK